MIADNVSGGCRLKKKFNHSVLCHSPMDAVEAFSYVYPVYLFTFIDYFLCETFLFSYRTCIQLYLVL